ncbi:hypothetical protein WN944_003748 [Citrus x changshan-huyou]|uniref:Uncharacterized protein n=1 Tax=Citrus x changshan-huyou TaxID=2935761 RepID=A0AAP0LZ59_9ROSI
MLLSFICSILPIIEVEMLLTCVFCVGLNILSLMKLTNNSSALVVEELARSIMHEAVRAIVGRRNTASESIKQKLVFAGSEKGKLLALRQSFAEPSFVDAGHTGRAGRVEKL